MYYIACQAPLFMEFPRQEGCHFLPHFLPSKFFAIWTVSSGGLSLQPSVSASLMPVSRACVCMLSHLQSYLTPCNPMECSLPGSYVRGILQARILELVAMPSSRASFQPRVPTCISYICCIGRWVPYD